VVGKESVAVDEVQVALAGVREPKPEVVDVLRGVKAQQIAQPFFHGVVRTIPNWLIKLDLSQRSLVSELAITAGLRRLDSHLVLLTETLEQL